jgi:pyruvate formate lyase activating enzyme
MKEAMFYQREGEGHVRCTLCRFRCRISRGDRGICGVRENREGTLSTLVYGALCAENVDPIEKKPLFHVLPGSRTYSIATMGCNFRCQHCQNYSISQVPPDAVIQGVYRSPEEIVRKAKAAGCDSIAYTYTEPTIFFEFAYDTARLACEAGLTNIFVTNGYIAKEPLALISPFLHAANIDLKGFSEEFYREVVHASLSQVVESIIEYRRLGIWVEITTLLIPGLNDSEDELQGIASFIYNSLGADTPWHVSQFYPTYQLLDRPRTPLTTLRRAREIGRAAGLRYVYEGNVPGEGGENSWCPFCSTLLIQRHGYEIGVNRIRNGECPACGTEIAGIGM